MSFENNNNITDDDSKQPFIEEYIIPKKDRKLKKILCYVITTTILAILFGVVARIVYFASDPIAYKLLGQKGNQDELFFPSTSPSPESKTEKTKKDNTSDTTSKDNTSSSNSIEDSNLGSKNTLSNLDDYKNIYTLIRGVVNEANKSIVTISGIGNTVDWFNNPKETVSAGIIIAEDSDELLILTSKYKIEEEKNLKVTFQTSLTVKAKIYDYDIDTGLAILAVPRANIPDSTLVKTKIAVLGESYTETVGDPIIAIGNPNGYMYSMCLGIITSKNNYINITDRKLESFHTDIEDDKSSNGIMINLNGEVIGIVSQSVDAGSEEDNTVIAISDAKPIINRLIKNSKRTYCGIRGVDLTKEAAKNLKVSAGVCITEIESNSPAYKAGLLTGDIIIKIDDTVIPNINIFYNEITQHQENDIIRVKVKRKIADTSQIKILKVKLKKDKKLH